MNLAPSFRCFLGSERNGAGGFGCSMREPLRFLGTLGKGLGGRASKGKPGLHFLCPEERANRSAPGGRKSVNRGALRALRKALQSGHPGRPLQGNKASLGH